MSDLIRVLRDLKMTHHKKSDLIRVLRDLKLTHQVCIRNTLNEERFDVSGAAQCSSPGTASPRLAQACAWHAPQCAPSPRQPRPERAPFWCGRPGRLSIGLVSMRAECTLPTSTSKPNRNTINTIEHAGTFACRVCFDLTSVECGNWRVEEKKSKSGGKFRKLVPDIEQRRRQGVWCYWETEFNFQDPRYKPASAVNEDVKSANRDKFILFMEDLVRDLKKENSDTEVSYKNDDFFNMYKMVCDCFI